MDTKDEKPESNETIEVPAEKKKSALNPKVFIFGVPLFILQLLIVYFVTANILLSKIHQNNPELAGGESENGQQTENADTLQNSQQNVELGKFIFLVEDVIVNPAGTEGKRFLLTTVGFDIATEEEMKELQSKEVLVKDMVISKLSSKDIVQLNNSAYRDTIRTELSSEIKRLIPRVNINNIYFSKYIFQ
ncbi:MAG: flagellar basal body-associated FliL family protein [Ignavibacteriales bacterium]|nr:MAG: flagellar basal body-associated FliL family protein [Ignavibacteriales bacterium]